VALKTALCAALLLGFSGFAEEVARPPQTSKPGDGGDAASLRALQAQPTILLDFELRAGQFESIPLARGLVLKQRAPGPSRPTPKRVPAPPQAPLK